jgi:hypothetical protein
LTVGLLRERKEERIARKEEGTGKGDVKKFNLGFSLNKVVRCLVAQIGLGLFGT